MKKSVTRKSPFVLFLAMLMVFVAACSSSPPAQTGGESGEGAAEAGGSETAEQPGGGDGPFRYSTMVSTFAEVPDMNNQFWTRFQKENNIQMDVEWVPSGEFQEKLNLALATGELADVLSVQDPYDINVTNSIERGVFWELGQFLGDFSQYPNLKAHIPETAWKYSKYNGQVYYIPRARSQINVGYMIRKDLLDEAGVSVPETVDELIPALKAMKEQDPDIMGLLFTESLQFAFGTATPQYNSEGGMYANVLHDGYTDMIDWYSKAYAEGLMSQEFTSIVGTEPDNFFLSGRLAFHFKNFWHQYRFDQENKKLKPSAEVEIIPYLSGPGGNSAYLEPGFTGGLFIPKKVPEDKVKKILEVFNLAASEENSEALFYGYEGIHHHLENGKYVMTEIGQKEIQSFTNDPFSIKRNMWDKVDSPLAPVEVDLANREKVKVVLDVLDVDPYKIIDSPTWSAEWTKHNDEFISMRTQAIMGMISMDDYRNYVESLRNDPALQPAFMELAESYEEFFGS